MDTGLRWRMSGLTGPHTQGGFHFGSSQLDSQPNFDFDLTQDGNGYEDVHGFSALTQVLITDSGLSGCLERADIRVPP